MQNRADLHIQHMRAKEKINEHTHKTASECNQHNQTVDVLCQCAFQGRTGFLGTPLGSPTPSCSSLLLFQCQARSIKRARRGKCVARVGKVSSAHPQSHPLGLGKESLVGGQWVVGYPERWCSSWRRGQTH